MIYGLLRKSRRRGLHREIQRVRDSDLTLTEAGEVLIKVSGDHYNTTESDLETVFEEFKKWDERSIESSQTPDERFTRRFNHYSQYVSILESMAENELTPPKILDEMTESFIREMVWDAGDQAYIYSMIADNPNTPASTLMKLMKRGEGAITYGWRTITERVMKNPNYTLEKYIDEFNYNSLFRLSVEF